MQLEPDDQLSDMILIQRCITGDDESFTILYQRYRLPLFAYLHKLLPNQHDRVDDFFQQVWIKALKNFSGYSDQQRFLAWLCRIAHNLVMDYYRSTDSREMSEIQENVPADSLDPQEVLLQQGLEEALQQAIRKLSPEQQEIVRMRISGISFKDIAAQKNISLNTALGRMHYAVQNLRQLLADFL
ncbi:MAG: sigma-70 family RNA polymerase sigma factor [Oligosphaeraceae bacterium]|jgi:RNA polymerase sigma-70 factor (ECF subfamily)|nr:sigma-70 family RNA polymerase sigma factor [Oligosphaeraceae bacterium]